MKCRWRSVLLVFVAIVLVALPTTRADMIVAYSGCYVCRSVGINTNCVYPDNNSWGKDTCKETVSDITNCDTSGYGCYYTEVGPGSGGGGGGGDNGGCQYQGGYCPVECFSCGPGYY